MVLLSINPDWQARARDEVLEVFGTEKPTFDGLTHLKVVSDVICHTCVCIYIYIMLL